MFNYMLMPLEKQPDDGLGSVGRAFADAAKILLETKCEGSSAKSNIHLPINFLFRHAIELYLKSMIVLIHRRLRLKDSKGKYTCIPEIVTGKKKKGLYNVHSIRILFEEMKRLVNIHEKMLANIAPTDWAKIPKELVGMIETIEASDPSSTVFRYPSTRNCDVDTKKSSFKEINPEKLKDVLNNDSAGTFSLVVVDKNNNITESYALDKNPLPKVRSALENATEILLCGHLGMLAELGPGIKN